MHTLPYLRWKVIPNFVAVILHTEEYEEVGRCT